MGVDLSHPDLLGNLLPGNDFTDSSTQGGIAIINVGYADAHGTMSAGVVAAVGNNNLGGAGVAYNSKIVPVRCVTQFISGASIGFITSISAVSGAILWAALDAQADIILMNWELGSGNNNPLIEKIVDKMYVNGRNGKGALFVSGMGNRFTSNNNLAQQALLPAAFDNVIAVVAMDACFQKKELVGCDSTFYFNPAFQWRSKYGPKADVGAPGTRLWTTDIQGANGISTGDYYNNFLGTSAAASNVAGVLALILSANPYLTATQARAALESTCRKVNTTFYTYSSNVPNQPNGTWSNELGYGLVDAFAAVNSVLPTTTSDAGVLSIVSPTLR